MKMILSFLLLLNLTSVYQSTTSPFIGKWKGEDKQGIGYLQFDSAGYAQLQIYGELIGGESFKMQDEDYSLSYFVNENLTPIGVDFVLTNIETREERSLRMIAEFFGNDSLKLGSDFNEVRPMAFTDENAIILTRVR